MKILFTGATGVIGREAVPKLVAAGHEPPDVARIRPDERRRCLGDHGVVRFDRDDLVVLLCTPGPQQPTGESEITRRGLPTRHRCGTVLCVG